MKFLKIIFKIVLCIFIFILALITLTYIAVAGFTNPINNKEWLDDQKVLPYAEFSKDSPNLVTVRNIRNFSYTSTSTYDIAYYDKEFNLDEIEKVWYAVVPFSGIPGSAHTLLSFQFKNNNYVAISVEARKEIGEDYHPVEGIFNKYELMYVIADEKDVIKLRSNFRKNDVYLYPASTTPAKAKQLFLSMLNKANELKENPEFYNTIVNACTSNIVYHINKVTPDSIPLLSKEILFPADSDRFAYDLGLIDTDLPFSEAKEKFHINKRALEFADDPNFSVRIRE